MTLWHNFCYNYTIDKIVLYKGIKINPIDKFQKWFNEAINSKVIEPNAFSLASVGDDMKPSIRTVLLKSYDNNGFIFFSDKNSKKATQISQNPNIAMNFAWLNLDRQIKIEGKVEIISNKDMVKYLFSRPKGINALEWISLDSRVVTARSILENKFDNMINKFSDGSLEFPSLWRGYIIKPTLIEFWQGGIDKLHTREVYRVKNNKWEIVKL